MCRIVRDVTAEQRKASLSEVVSVDSDLKGGFTIDDFLDGCPTVKREQVERYLELAQELVVECAS
jgi:hypothetical protein